MIAQPQPVKTAPKTRRIGRYTLIKRVGRGSSGRVYLARDGQSGQPVAVKLLGSQAQQSERRLVRFYQEAKLAMRIDHPNLVRALEIGREHGRHFVAMEYVRGGTLKELLRNTRCLPEIEALQLLMDVATGLAAIHEQNVLHRDIKLSNVLLTAEGRAKLGDLGLAKQSEANFDLTMPGKGLGTPQYMAPEQFCQASRVEATADIYSLGVMLYMLVTGRSPFVGETPMEQLLQKLKNNFADPREVNPNLSEQTAELIIAAMDSDPCRRPQTAAEFLSRASDCLCAETSREERVSAPCRPVSSPRIRTPRSKTFNEPSQLRVQSQPNRPEGQTCPSTTDWEPSLRERTEQFLRSRSLSGAGSKAMVRSTGFAILNVLFGLGLGVGMVLASQFFRQ